MQGRYWQIKNTVKKGEKIVKNLEVCDPSAVKIHLKTKANTCNPC